MTAFDTKQGWIEEIVTLHQPGLIRYAHGHLGDLEQARDVVQDTFLRLCKQAPDDVVGHVKPWLYTVCRRRCLDVLKKEKRMVPLSDTQSGTMAGTEHGPSKALENLEACGQAAALLNDLSHSQQEAIRLKVQHELSYREISEVMGISMSNVGYLLHEGIRKLRRQWQLQNAI